MSDSGFFYVKYPPPPVKNFTFRKNEILTQSDDIQQITDCFPSPSKTAAKIQKISISATKNFKKN